MDSGRRRLGGLDDLGAQAIFPQREYHVANLVMITVGGSDGNECSQEIWYFNLGASRRLSSPSALSLTRRNVPGDGSLDSDQPDTLHRRISRS
jgi:hypothetical protein